MATREELAREIAVNRASNYDLDALIDIATEAEYSALLELPEAEVAALHAHELDGSEPALDLKCRHCHKAMRLLAIDASPPEYMDADGSSNCPDAPNHEPVTTADLKCKHCGLTPRSVAWRTSPAIGDVCHACGTIEEQIVMILAFLGDAPSYQLNQRTLARKIGVKASELHGALQRAVKRKLITRAYPTSTREAPSETTYKLVVSEAAIASVTRGQP